MRRRVWDQAYSVKALQKHEPAILEQAVILKSALGAFKGRAVDATEWFVYYCFDVMGLVQFSYPFKMLQSAENRWVVDMVKGGTLVLGYLSSMPWLVRALCSVPSIQKEVAKYQAWCGGRIRDRMRMDTKDEDKHTDTMGWLLENARETSSVEADWNGLVGDTMNMVTGSTDPMILCLTFVSYYLAASPERVSNLRAEIRTLTSYSDTVQLQALPYLNALIYETLRLHPGVPSGGLRVTPPEGLWINDTFISGRTIVSTPHYTLQRREDCFVHADEFIPERWTTRPELVKNKAAYIPWGVGKPAPPCSPISLSLISPTIILPTPRH